MDRLRTSLRALVNRHKGLNAIFMLADEQVIQVVRQKADPELRLLDYDRYGTIEAAFDDFLRPFDLSQRPPIRFGLLRPRGNPPVLFVDIHHIVCDGLSLNILIQDFVRLYRGEPLSPPRLSYIDYACWQNGASPKLEDQKRFWERQLSGKLSYPELPVRRERNTVRRFTAGACMLVIDSEEVAAMRRIAASVQVSDFMFLLSGYFVLLWKLTGNNDVLIGTDAAGRTHPGLKEVAGTFVNLLPLRLQISGGSSYTEFLGAVRECVLDAFSNQDFPFDQMVALVRRKEKLQDNPIARVHFAFANYFDAVTEPGGHGFQPLAMRERLATSYEFKLEAKEKEGRWHIAFIYSRELYDASFIEAIKGYYHHILRTALRDLSIPLGNIQLTNA